MAKTKNPKYTLTVRKRSPTGGVSAVYSGKDLWKMGFQLGVNQ